MLNRLLLACFATLACTLAAHAQYGPAVPIEQQSQDGIQSIERNDPDMANPNPNATADPNTNNNPNAFVVSVPDYIKPGFQMLYMTASSTEAQSPESPGGAGMGFTEFTVIAVTPEDVIVSATNYLAPKGLPLTPQGEFDPTTDPRVQLMGSNTQRITQADVQSGGALWMPVDQLKQWEPGNGILVDRSPRTYKGQQVQATSIIVTTPNSISSDTFNSTNGQKLVTRSGMGSFRRNATGNDPYDRQIQNLMKLVDTRQLNSPLLGSPDPDWAQRVQTMQYAGSYTMIIPGMQTPAVPMATTVTFDKRSNGITYGTAKVQTQDDMPNSTAVMQGPGTMLGYWVHPQTLAQLNAGVIDRHPIMRLTLSYQVQQGNMGQMGVFVLTNDIKSFFAVSGYNLQTGAMTYTSLQNSDPGTKIEFQLQNMQ